MAIYISTIKAHTGRSTGRSTTKLESSQGELTFVILELILADPLADLPTSRVILW